MKIVFTLLFHSYLMVDPTKWKQCKDSGFCTRQRAFADLIDTVGNEIKNPTINLDKASLEKSRDDLTWKAYGFEFGDTVKAKLKMGSEPEIFNIEFLFTSDFVRFQVTPSSQKRYRTPFSTQNIEYTQYLDRDEDGNTVLVNNINGVDLEITGKPFQFKVSRKGVLLMSFNRRGYLYYETFPKGSAGPLFAQPANQSLMAVTIPQEAINGDEVVAGNAPNTIQQLQQKLLTNLGEEYFGGNTDTKPNGATSIGFDLTFEDSVHLFGLPEHSSAFNLKSTRGPEKEYDEPFRLYNVDIFEHLNDSPMAMYGNVPFLMSHRKGQSSAVLMLNSAEMWVDIERIPSANAGQKSGSSHWMAESGIIDMFIFAGPTQQDIFNAYTKLTGRPQLPQEFALGHHSCRWNYNDEKDCLDVDFGFDEYEIPYDVLWLDIEHTNGKRYFTFDEIKFPNPEKLQKTLAAKGRKMVTIIDPHIKKDSSYSVSKNAADLDIFVKTKDLSVLDGDCWPGQSNWIDYTNSKARDFWAEQFEYHNYKGSTPTLYTWNDMNEPSVFSGPEVTMPKDSIHFDNVEHRDVHNVYGMLLVLLI